MTATEINALSDAELVWLAAKKVIGLSCVTKGCPETRINYRTISPLPENDFEEEWRVWSPLESWDHCWMIIEEMRNKGWRLKLSDFIDMMQVEFVPSRNSPIHASGCSVFVDGELSKISDNVQRRTIVKAALQVVLQSVK